MLCQVREMNSHVQQLQLANWQVRPCWHANVIFENVLKDGINIRLQGVFCCAIDLNIR